MARILSELVQIETLAKSFILRGVRCLARHKAFDGAWDVLTNYRCGGSRE